MNGAGRSAPQALFYLAYMPLFAIIRQIILGRNAAIRLTEYAQTFPKSAESRR
jgi:hypothetical protein